MKKVEVVAAIIIKDNRILATQRGHGVFDGKWEFPGGKIEVGETPEEALKREIQEELGIKIDIKEFYQKVEFTYETFHLSMRCYLCTMASSEITLKEHKNALFLRKDMLDSVSWLAADIEVVKKIKESNLL